MARCRENPLIPLSRALAIPRHDREGRNALPWSPKVIRAMMTILKREGWDPKRHAKVTVKRDGTLFVDEGNHRLAAAKRIGLRRVPVEYYTPDGRSVTRRNPPGLRVTEEYLGGHHGQQDLVLRATRADGSVAAALAFSVFRGRVYVNHVRSESPGAGFRLANELVRSYGLDKIAPGMTTPDGTRLLAAVRARWRPQVVAARLWRKHARAVARKNPRRPRRARALARRRRVR